MRVSLSAWAGATITILIFCEHSEHWVIVRPVILTNGPQTNAYRVLVDPRGWTFGFISGADVADFLVKQIDDDAFLHKTPVLTS